jgi:hypothetical protein
MSTYVTRFIEIKNKDTGKWELLKWTAPAKLDDWEHENRGSVDVNGEEHHIRCSFSDNACTIRSYLNDNWSFVSKRFKDRGVPDDASEELKKVFADETAPGDDGRTYSYNYSYYTLDELEELYDELSKQAWDSIKREILYANNNSIELKLNKILANQHKQADTTVPVNTLKTFYLPDDDFEKKLKEYKNSDEDNLHYVKDTFYEVVDDLLGVRAEIVTVHALTYHLAGYFRDDIRITFYFE